MKKTSLLFIAIFSLAAGISRGATPVAMDSPSFTFTSSAGVTTSAAVANEATPPDSNFARGLNRAAGASFAQLNTPPRQMPSSSMWIFAVMALGVIAGRIFDLRRAKALADHEHETYQARDRMYHSLYKRD